LSCGFDLMRHLLGGGTVTNVIDNYIRTRSGESQRNGSADTRIRTGYERGLPLQEMREIVH
jgi:hypothetical protein